MSIIWVWWVDFQIPHLHSLPAPLHHIYASIYFNTRKEKPLPLDRKGILINQPKDEEHTSSPQYLDLTVLEVVKGSAANSKARERDPIPSHWSSLLMQVFHAQWPILWIPWFQMKSTLPISTGPTFLPHHITTWCQCHPEKPLIVALFPSS